MAPTQPMYDVDFGETTVARLNDDGTTTLVARVRVDTYGQLAAMGDEQAWKEARGGSLVGAYYVALRDGTIVGLLHAYDHRGWGFLKVR